MGHIVQPTRLRRSAGRPRDPAVDAAILTAALTLFAERGFDGVSFEEVAERAGVARTTIYRRWSSKADLIAEAIATGRGAPELALSSADLSADSLRRQLVDSVAEALAAPKIRDVIASLIGAAPNHPELMEIYWRTYMAPRRAAIAEVLERARGEGLIRPDANLEILLDLMGGALMHHLLIRPGRRSARELKVYLLDVLRELGVTGEEPPS